MFAGGPSKAQLTVFELEALDRALTDDESAMLERALRRLGPKRDLWRWSAKDDRRLKLLIKRRGYSLRIKPFAKNDEVQRIADGMGRSYLAVHKRIQRLRAKMPDCPNADDRANR
jgi:hypothetical protein